MESSICFGDRIRTRRREVGLTAARLASIVGVTENAIRKLESGDTVEPRFSTGLRIASALAISPRELADAASVRDVPELALVIRAIRAIRPSLDAEGVRHIDIFGSIARGNALPTSDIDVIVTPKPDARFTLFNLTAVGNFLEESLGRKVDLITPTALESSTFATDVGAESVRAF